MFFKVFLCCLIIVIRNNNSFIKTLVMTICYDHCYEHMTLVMTIEFKFFVYISFVIPSNETIFYWLLHIGLYILRIHMIHLLFMISKIINIFVLCCTLFQTDIFFLEIMYYVQNHVCCMFIFQIGQHSFFLFLRINCVI